MTVEIPQATLQRIRAVVSAVANGSASSDAIASALEVSPRHVRYAVGAAIALNLLREPQRGRFELTGMGDRLARTSAGSVEEAEAFRGAVQTSSVVRQIAPGLLSDDPPSREYVAGKIAKRAGLSEATADHRAAMILRWRDRLMQPSLPLFDRHPHWGGLWRRIELRNYRSIEHVQLDLPPFVAVVGPNGSGKSNLADAFVFVRDIGTNATTAMETRGGIAGVRRWRPTRPTDVTVDVRAARSQSALDSEFVRHQFKIRSGRAGNWHFKEETIEVVSKRKRRRLTREGQNLRLEDGGERLPKVTETASVMALAGQLADFRKTSSLRSVRRYRLNTEEMTKPQLSSEQSRLEESGSNIAVALRSLTKADYDELRAAMTRIVPGLLDVYVEPVGRFLSLRFRQMQSGDDVAEFNATEMSEGTLRALGIVVAALQMKSDELLIIEEPEVSIHVGVANVLFEILKDASQRGSVLITTHSADLLDAARDEEILVCEYEDGLTRVGPLDATQREVVREGLFSAAELMRTERLRIQAG